LFFYYFSLPTQTNRRFVCQGIIIMDSKVIASSSETLRTTNVLFCMLIFLSWVFAATASVSYDNKAILINGRRRVLISGSIHYPRSTPEVRTYQLLVPIDHGLFFLLLLNSSMLLIRIYIYIYIYYMNIFFHKYNNNIRTHAS